MYTGITGALKMRNILGELRTVAYISGWSITDKSEIIESTRLAGQDKKTLPGMKSWSASADGTIVFANGVGYEKLLALKNDGLSVELLFYLNDDPDNDKTVYLRGSAHIESISYNLSAEDKGSISISVTGDGPLDCYVNGKNICRHFDKEEEVTFRVNESGELLVTIPDRYQGMATLDEENHILRISL